MLRLLIESDNSCTDILTTPRNFVRNVNERSAFEKATNELLSEVITDLNAEIDQLEEDFDYRGRLRDEKWCAKLAHEIAATHKKLVDRERLDDFATMIARQTIA